MIEGEAVEQVEIGNAQGWEKVMVRKKIKS
jgi:hypothetical protein